MHAENVGTNEVAGIEDRAVDMGFGGEVDNRFAPLGRIGHGGAIHDVALDESVLNSLQVGWVAGVGELVEDDDVVARGDEPLDEMASDEAAAACDENSHPPILGHAFRHLRRLGELPSKALDARAEARAPMG